MKIKFKKGTKQGFPQLLKNIVPYFGKRTYRYAITFTSDTLYQYPNKEDNDDWRKAAGVTFKRTDNHWLCAMVAFTCNFEKRSFNISPYYHDRGSKSWVGGGGNYYDENSTREGLGKENVFEVALNQRIVVEISVSNKEVFYKFFIGGKVFEHKGEFVGAGNFSWEIQSWWGGTLPPYQDQSFELEFL
jgi:hypothetical protein